MRKRREYTKQFKESAIDLYRRNSEEKTPKDVAEELGISTENLRRWLRESQESEEKNIKAFPGQGNPRDEEMARFKKEIADLRETNEILKKAVAIFTTRRPL